MGSVILVLILAAIAVSLVLIIRGSGNKQPKQQVLPIATSTTPASDSWAIPGAAVASSSVVPRSAAPTPAYVQPTQPTIEPVVTTSSDAMQSVSASGAQEPVQEKAVVPVSSQAVAPVPVSGSSVIGQAFDTGSEMSISQAARLQGLYIIGVNGTGKSTFISNLIAEDMQQGLGLCLLDPHGDLTADVLARVPEHRLEDVILLDLMDSAYPFGLNVFECPDPSNLEQVALTASFVMHVFEKVWDVGTSTPQLAQVLRNVTFTLIQNPGTTLNELPLLLQDEQVRNKMVANVTNNQVKLFWTTYNRLRTGEQIERSSSTLNKADAFLTQPIIANIVGQSHTTLDFRKIMDEGKILLVQLTPQLEDLSRLIGSVVIGQLLMAAMSRRDTPENERKQFNLYADEYQRFATPDFATLLSEARKFKVATTIAHQYLDQLDDQNRGASVNAANLVVFRVSGQDAAILAKEFDATPEESLEFRTEPIRSPARDPLSQLLQKGHQNTLAVEFVNEFLTAYHDKAELWTSQQHPHPLKGFWKAAEHSLNTLLYSCMVEGTSDVVIPDLVMLSWLQHFRFHEGGDFPNVFYWIEGDMKSFKKKQAFDWLCSPNWERYETQLRQVIKKKNHPDELLYFLSGFRYLMRSLAEEPILVDTGQYREVRDKPRPYADVQAEIATKLANCPNYQARVKTVGHEAIVSMRPAVPGVPENVLESRRLRVLEHTRATYCRPRSQVEEEIAARQLALLEEPEVKPKSRRQTTED